MSKLPSLAGPERIFTYDEALRTILGPPPTGRRAGSDFVRCVLWLSVYCSKASKAEKFIAVGGEEALMKLVEGPNAEFAEIAAIALGKIWDALQPSVATIIVYAPRFMTCFRRHSENTDTLVGWANALTMIGEQLVVVGGAVLREICEGLLLLLRCHASHRELAENCCSCVANIALAYRQRMGVCFPVPGAPSAVLGALRGQLHQRDGVCRIVQVVAMLQLTGVEVLRDARGLIPALRAAVQRYPRDEELPDLAAACFTTWSLAAPCMRVLVRLGVSEDLCTMLRLHHAKPGVAWKCISVLARMACNDGNTAALLSHGAVEAACSVLRSHPDVAIGAEDSCSLLRLLAASAAGRAQVMASGAPALIAAALRAHAADEGVAREACGALRNLLAESSSRGTLMKLGAAWGIISCLRSRSSSDEVVWAAMAALFGLACAPENREDLYRLGVAALTVSTLERWVGTMPIAWACCGVLLRLSEEKVLRLQLKEKDGVLRALGPIISGMYDPAGPVARAALACRANLRQAALPATGS